MFTEDIDEPEVINSDLGQDDDQPDEGGNGLPAHLKDASAKEVALYYQGQLDSERQARESLMGDLDSGTRGGRRKSEPEPDEPEPDEEDDFSALADIDLVDLLAEKGLPGLVEVLIKAGVVTTKGVKKQIKGEFSQLEQAYTLQQEYPELADAKSEFSQATQTNIAALNRDPDFKNLPPAKKFQLAARQAQAELGTGARTRKSGARDEPDERGYYVGGNEDEDARAQRIGRQAGPRGQRSRQPDSQSSNQLSPEQKNICRKLGVSEKAYAARAQKGVTIHRRSGR